jgi:hypothetical protein
MILIYLVQNAVPLEPGSAAELATGQRQPMRTALPGFQALAYEALGK